MLSLFHFYFKSLSTEKSKAKVGENIFFLVCMRGCANYFLLFLKSRFPPSFKCDGKNLKITDGQGDINLHFFPQLNQIHIWLHLTNSIGQLGWRQFLYGTKMEQVRAGQEWSSHVKPWVCHPGDRMTTQHQSYKKGPTAVRVLWLWYKRVKNKKVPAIPWNSRERSAIPWVGWQKKLKLPIIHTWCTLKSYLIYNW